MIENIQQYINLLSPILSAIGGVLISLTLLSNKFRNLKKSVESSVQGEINSNRKHKANITRLEKQVSELNKKLNYLVDKDKGGK